MNPKGWRRWWLPLAALASVTLAAGVWLSLQPDRTLDLEHLGLWARAWGSGVNSYAPPDSVVDYPPWALVVLWPLSFVPATWQAAVWVAVNVGLVAAVVSRLARRAIEPGEIQVRLALLLTAAACFRTLNQFSLLSYALALYGASARSPVGGGMLLGLSLIKPQIGGVVVAWEVLRGRWRAPLAALAVPCVLTAAYAARVHASVWQVVGQDAAALARVHGAADPLPGHTELRAWLVALHVSWAGRLEVSAVLAVLLMLPALWAAWRRSRWTPDAALELLALCGATSLLAVRHLSYDFVLLLPALVAWRVWPFTAAAHRAVRTWMFFGLAFLLLVEVPSLARAAAGIHAPWALTEMDRATALAAWAILSWRLTRGAEPMTE